ARRDTHLRAQPPVSRLRLCRLERDVAVHALPAPVAALQHEGGAAGPGKGFAVRARGPRLPARGDPRGVAARADHRVWLRREAADAWPDAAPLLPLDIVEAVDGHGPGAEGDGVPREHETAGVEILRPACRLEFLDPVARVLIGSGHGPDYALSCAHGKVHGGYAPHAREGASPGALRRRAGLAAPARRSGAERARRHP